MTISFVGACSAVIGARVEQQGRARVVAAEGFARFACK